REGRLACRAWAEAGEAGQELDEPLDLRPGDLLRHCALLRPLPRKRRDQSTARAPCHMARWGKTRRSSGQLADGRGAARGLGGRQHKGALPVGAVARGRLAVPRLEAAAEVGEIGEAPFEGDLADAAVILGGVLERG